MQDDFIIKDSDIHGKGVFARRNFKAEEIVLRWDTSEMVSAKEVEKMNNEERRYISYMDGKYIRMQAPVKYVNHSCNANTTAKQFCDIAKRDIKEGEEITADYRQELPAGTVMECNCGSFDCSSIIDS